MSGAMSEEFPKIDFWRAIVTVSIEWDGTHITVTNESLDDDAGTTRVTDVAGMLADCTNRAMEAVWNGLNKEEQR